MAHRNFSEFLSCVEELTVHERRDRLKGVAHAWMAEPIGPLRLLQVDVGISALRKIWDDLGAFSAKGKSAIQGTLTGELHEKAAADDLDILASAISSCVLLHHQNESFSYNVNATAEAAENDAQYQALAVDFEYEPGRRSLRYRGQQYALTSAQDEAMRVLWEAWKKGQPDVHQDFIAEQRRTAGFLGSKRLRDIFKGKGKALWGTLIVQGNGKGMFRLSIPAPD